MGADLKITVDGIDKLKATLGDILNARRMTALNRAVGIGVRERVADHLARASVSRHRTADRLGARHTKFLEFAMARGQLKGGSSYEGKGASPFTEVREIDQSGATVVIGNTPGLRRAFSPITITPKRAKALTIPISREAYGYGARELEAKTGRRMFCITSRKGHGLLVEGDRSGKGSGRIRPQYLLVKSVTLRKDEGLLPSSAEISAWASCLAEKHLESLLG